MDNVAEEDGSEWDLTVTIWNSHSKPKYIISIGDIKENRNSELSVIGPLAFYGDHLLLFSCCQIGSLGDY